MSAFVDSIIRGVEEIDMRKRKVVWISWIIMLMLMFAGCDGDGNGITIGDNSSSGVVDTDQRTCYDNSNAIGCPSNG
jgi:hypothetical protein